MPLRIGRNGIGGDWPWEVYDGATVIDRFASEAAAEALCREREADVEDAMHQPIEEDIEIDHDAISEWALRETMRRDPALEQHLYKAGFDGQEVKAFKNLLKHDREFHADDSYFLREAYIPIRKASIVNGIPAFQLIPPGDDRDWSHGGRLIAEGIISMVIPARMGV